MSEEDRVTDATIIPNEYVRVLGRRAKHLQLGARPTIEWKGRFDSIAIAKEEINQRRIPLVINRKIRNGTYETMFREEIWDINEMNIRGY